MEDKIRQQLEETEQQYAQLREDYQQVLAAKQQTEVNLIALEARIMTLKGLLENNDAADTTE